MVPDQSPWPSLELFTNMDYSRLLQQQVQSQRLTTEKAGAAPALDAPQLDMLTMSATAICCFLARKGMQAAHVQGTIPCDDNLWCSALTCCIAAA